MRDESRGIPKNKSYPPDAVQCNQCGGYGCSFCEDNGWLPKDHLHGRTCLNDDVPIPPDRPSSYCSDRCKAVHERNSR
jgi:hypothetical protein